jgi:hypothetical protein
MCKLERNTRAKTAVAIANYAANNEISGFDLDVDSIKFLLHQYLAISYSSIGSGFFRPRLYTPVDKTSNTGSVLIFKIASMGE